MSSRRWIAPRDVAHGANSTEALMGGVMPTNITRDELQELIREGAQIVDVLPPSEFAEYHLPGAINIPLKDLDATTTEQLSKDKPAVVY